jgi:ABC-type dipeptide/oligopeptide/nickel transport system permease subunit
VNGGFAAAGSARAAAGAVRAFVWLAGLVPFLAHRHPLVRAGGEGLSFPAVAALSGEDLFWLALVAADAARALLRRGARAGAVAATAAWFLCAAGALLGESPRAGVQPAGGFELRTPVGFGPDEADWELVNAPGVALPAAPSARHWLGTDSHARDLLARLLYGTRVSLGVGAAATAIALSIGLAAGLLCGTLRGWVDLLLMRVVEVLLCFPHLFLVLIVFAYLPHSRSTLVLLLGLVGWTTTARLARGELLRLHGEDFVTAAQALGASPLRLALRHYLPNALAPVLVAATFSVSGAMLAEFALSWLGLGVAPPTPSLGQILAEGQRLLARGTPWIALAPGLLIFAVVLSFNAWGESLRRATTPERARGGRAFGVGAPAAGTGAFR